MRAACRQHWWHMSPQRQSMRRHCEQWPAQSCRTTWCRPPLCGWTACRGCPMARWGPELQLECPRAALLRARHLRLCPRNVDQRGPVPAWQVDRGALPRADGVAPDTEPYVAPSNPAEEAVQAAWHSVLTSVRHPISVTANFFAVRSSSHPTLARIMTCRQLENLQTAMALPLKRALLQIGITKPLRLHCSWAATAFRQQQSCRKRGQHCARQSRWGGSSTPRQSGAFLLAWLTRRLQNRDLMTHRSSCSALQHQYDNQGE